MSEFIIWLGVLGLIIVLFGTAAYASFSAAPWLPLRGKDHARVLKFLTGRKGTFFELGAGDARMVVDVARHTNLHAIGFEISAIPFLAGSLRLLLSGVRTKTEMKFNNFFHEDFSKADAIFCFLTPPAMKKLKEKFEKEVRPGTRIISYSFKVPDWTPTVVDREGTGIPVFVYDR